LLLPLLVSFGPGGLPAALNGGVGHQFAMQVLGVVTVAVWSAAASYVIIKLAALTVGLRVTRDEEIQGLDYASHGETAYHVGS
jgi:Amt family ammonium transporter